MALRVNRRNRRQISKDLPPPAVPLLFYIFLMECPASAFVKIFMRNGGDGTALPADFLNLVDSPEIVTSGGANCISAETINDGSNTVLILEFDDSPIDGQTIRWPQWNEAVRGINGEWVAPCEMEVQPG